MHYKSEHSLGQKSSDFFQGVSCDVISIHQALTLRKVWNVVGRGYNVIVAYLGRTDSKATLLANFICSLILHISVKAQKMSMQAWSQRPKVNIGQKVISHRRAALYRVSLISSEAALDKLTDSLSLSKHTKQSEESELHKGQSSVLSLGVIYY